MDGGKELCMRQCKTARVPKHFTRFSPFNNHSTPTPCRNLTKSAALNEIKNKSKLHSFMAKFSTVGCLLRRHWSFIHDRIFKVLGSSIRCVVSKWSVRAAGHGNHRLQLWWVNNSSKVFLSFLHIRLYNDSTGVLFPYYDHDTRMVYVAGKGDGNVRYYEVVDEPECVYYLNQFISGEYYNVSIRFSSKQGRDW